MRKLNIVVSAIAVVTLLAPAGFGFAQSSLDLGAESTGLLPSNPFYFLKEFGRGFRQFWAFNPIRKAQLELNTVNEKAAELKKLEEISSENIEAIERAAENYKNAVTILKSRLESLKGASQNTNLDKLLDQLADRSLKHQRLFDELLLKFPTEEELLGTLDEAQAVLSGAISVASESVDSPENFRRRFISAVENQKDDLKELRGAALIDRAEDRLSDIKAIKEISILKDELLLRFSGRLEGLDSVSSASAILQGFAGDRASRLRILDEVREKVPSAEIKSGINLIRQKILSSIEEKDGISKEEAEQAIASSKKLLNEVLKRMQELGTVRTSVKDLANRAKFSLEQATRFYEEENYGSAYGQATAAYAAAKNAWAQLVSNTAFNIESIENLKKQYDALREKASSLGLNKEGNPKLFALFSEAEKKLVELTKLIETNASPEAVSFTLRNVKITLSAIEELIRNIVEPRVVPEPLPAVEPVPATSSAAPAVKDIIVAILDDGFFPSVLRVSKGTNVTWVNKDSVPHWPASDPHPTHHLLPGFDPLRPLQTGDNYSFTFDKAGSWKYHDNLNPSLTAVVEVVE